MILTPEQFRLMQKRSMTVEEMGRADGKLAKYSKLPEHRPSALIGQDVVFSSRYIPCDISISCKATIVGLWRVIRISSSELRLMLLIFQDMANKGVL